MADLSQGRGVVAALAQDPEWKVRAVTRNAESATAKALQAQGAEVVSANLEDPTSVQKAIEVPDKSPFAVKGILTKSRVHLRSTESPTIGSILSATDI